jgi:hypothetical protein
MMHCIGMIISAPQLLWSVVKCTHVLQHPHVSIASTTDINYNALIMQSSPY